ncbi:MAG: DNA-formamidopyrimidine glycosylase family protein [Candidatus Bathyarchaeota archaeon]
MSVELPEATILTEQLHQRVLGKQVKSCETQESKGLQRIGMLEHDLTVFDQLIGAKIEKIISRGNVIVIKFDNKLDLIIGLEYGGELFSFQNAKNASSFHVKLVFADDTALTVRLTNMGVIQLLDEDSLDLSYVYNRDFDLTKLSPTDEDFTLECFSSLFSEKNKMLKSVLVGKGAIIVGISNSTFQDILYRARVHPKRKAAHLSTEETRRLYDAIKFVITERIRLDGKEEFKDIYQKRGSYLPAMGPHMKEQ